MPTAVSLVAIPKSPIAIAKVAVTGIEIDLSSQLTANGNTTVYTWKTKGGTSLVAGTDYTLTNGKTVFLKPQTDSVYCEMTNATFPGFTWSNALTTTRIKVTGIVGIEEIAGTSGFQIYSRNKTIHIVAPTNGQALVYDTNGRLVLAKDIAVGVNIVAMQKGGVYFVRFAGSNAPVVKKVFIGN